MAQDREDKDQKQAEAWVKAVAARAEARAVVEVWELAQEVPVSARIAEKKLHTRWELPVMSRNAQNAEPP